MYSCCATGLSDSGSIYTLQAYGEDIAILAGDALLSLSFEYIARETRNVAPERVLRVSMQTTSGYKQ